MGIEVARLEPPGAARCGNAARQAAEEAEEAFVRHMASALMDQSGISRGDVAARARAKREARSLARSLCPLIRDAAEAEGAARHRELLDSGAVKRPSVASRL